ncbi:dsDNA-specific endonuclease/ATPase MutS2 [Paenibacillus mucilaginosus]|uniref:endonuclease MutS2 n=1 Tax=Paenibacillus mucilaginosus TaxID=61624 RepID=UPI003D2205E4
MDKNMQMKVDMAGCLEYEKVKEGLLDHAKSYLGREHIRALMPVTDQGLIERWLEESAEAVKLIEHGASVPVPALDGMEPMAAGLGKGFLLTVSELGVIVKFLENTAQLKRFMSRKESIAPQVTSYALSLYELSEIRLEIERCIRHGAIDDGASPELAKVRKKIAIAEERLKKKLESTMQRYRSYLQEQVISMRGDRYVIPVKKEHRKLVAGSVLDESASGQTVFIEPAETASLTYELSALRAEESREETKVLGLLTDLVESHTQEIRLNLETIGHYDFLFAKAKYGLSIGGRTVEIGSDGRTRILRGRHPLLGAHAVPLDFEIGESYRALIITGPNTGGKTVTLKTVGLLTMMVQSGLMVPAAEGSRFSIFHSVLADIGDGQSLEQSLSTFSSHVKNVIRILDEAGPSALILLDELAAGTDPGEGIGLSIAVLEELYRRGSTVIATTHFNEIKRYAEAAEGFENARMEFDVETLRPLYRLTIGEAGQSYAFQIAAQLGMPAGIIARSKAITYGPAAAAGEAAGSSAASSSAGAGLVSLEEALQGPDREGAAGAEPSAGQRQQQPVRRGKREAARELQAEFEIGDCVWIHSLRRTGIVCGLADERGNLLILIQKEKVKINRKRLSLYIEREQLYPEGDYDMDIVFESKEVRKKRKMMSKRHDESVMIIHPPQGE